MSEAPDRLGYFVGWKGLLADEEGGLWSPSKLTLWPTGTLVAVCENNPKHKPPHVGCGCGIHALKTFDELKEHRYNWGGPLNINTPDPGERIWVLAELAMHGKYEAGNIGYRTGMAEVLTVYVSSMHLPLGAKIRKRYGLDLGTIDRFTGKKKLLTGRRK